MFKRVMMIGLLGLGVVAMARTDASAWGVCCVSYGNQDGASYHCDFTIKGAKGKDVKDSLVDALCQQSVNVNDIAGFCINQGGNISSGRAFSSPIQVGEFAPVNNCDSAGKCPVTVQQPTTQAQIQALINGNQALPPVCTTSPPDSLPPLAPTDPTTPAECVARIFGYASAAAAADALCFNESKTWTFFGARWKKVTLDVEVFDDAISTTNPVTTGSAVCTSPQGATLAHQDFTCN